MKKICFLSILAILTIAGCAPKTETEPVDLKAVNNEITQLVDQFTDAWNTEDLDALTLLIADNGLFYGSDPSEQLNKTTLLKMWKDAFADTNDYSYKVNMRKIQVADDGKSAFVIEHNTIDGWSPLMQVRQTFQFVQTGNNWKIYYCSWAFIAANDDVEKLNKALE
ncbi:YybH family protein [Bacteroidota bacterium]